MQGPALGTQSARSRVSLALSLLIVLTLVIVAVLSNPSSANKAAASSNDSLKPSGPEFVPGEALVRYRSERIAKRQTFQTLVSPEGHQLSIQIERFDGADIVPGLRLAHVAPEDTMAAIQALKQQPDVLYAEPNYILHLDATPNDPSFGQLYGLMKIGAPLAWDTIKGSTDAVQAGFGHPRIVVGVIDEGIDKLHPDLGTNIWTNPGEIAGNGVDDDGNGFVDDVNGYNFANNTGTIPADSHATHVAGTIGAIGNNNAGVVGVNWQVGLMSLKFIGGSSGETSDAIRASNYAKQMRDRWVSSGGTSGANVRVLNNSYGGGGFSQAFLDAILSLNQSGVLFVAAAGNAPDSPEPNNDLVGHYPSGYDAPNVIGVAATDSTDGLASFSHFGATTVHIGAPGVGILSTTPGNTYSVFSGTSMASPHVAGAAALLLAANPNLTVTQLRSLLIFNGDPVGSLSGKTLTGRRLNVGNSMAALNGNDVTPPGTATSFHINTQNGRALNVGWTASGDDGSVGQAALYELTFTDATTGTVLPLKRVIPAASGVTEAVDIKLPYRHTSGTLTLREFDNSGNEGVPATFGVSVSLLEGDPYLTSVGTTQPLSTGGTPLSLIGDDKLKLNYSLPFTFPFFGENFTKVNISTNGNLFFSAPPTRSNGDADDVPASKVGLAKFKMISGLWDDLRTDRAGGDVYVVTPDVNRIIFRWQTVTFGNGTGSTELPVSFEIELRSNGTILTRYGVCQQSSSADIVARVVGIAAAEPEAYVITSHTAEGTVLDLTNFPEVTFMPRANTVLSSVQFSVPQFSVIESDNPLVATMTVNRSGDLSTQAAVDYVTSDGSATQKGDYTFASGRVLFAAGEASKTIQILIVNDVFQEGTESFSATLSNAIGTTIGARNVAAVQILDDDLSPGVTNPLDNANALFFVRQHYLDFLNREPDSGGLAFWAGQITSCGSDAQCLEIKRINVSAAFFLSIEFQETGYLVYKMYKAAYNNLPGAPVPIRYGEFQPDSQQIALGVQVGIGNWQAQLESNKVAFSNDFVTRARFSLLYPTTSTPAQFVDMLIANAGFTPTASERLAFINEFGTATNTVDTAARARAVRKVAENSTFHQQELNKAFVLMQYFGYLRRNPYDPPESTLDYGGYNFWLGKLNQFGGNFVNAEMVKSFLVAGEYRHRFAP